MARKSKTLVRTITVERLLTLTPTEIEYVLESGDYNGPEAWDAKRVEDREVIELYSEALALHDEDLSEVLRTVIEDRGI